MFCLKTPTPTHSNSTSAITTELLRSRRPSISKKACWARPPLTMVTLSCLLLLLFFVVFFLLLLLLLLLVVVVAAVVVATTNRKRSWARSVQALLVLLLAGPPSTNLEWSLGEKSRDKTLPTDSTDVTPLHHSWKGASQAGSLVGPEYNTLRRNWSIGCNKQSGNQTGVRIARKHAHLD